MTKKTHFLFLPKMRLSFKIVLLGKKGVWAFFAGFRNFAFLQKYFCNSETDKQQNFAQDLKEKKLLGFKWEKVKKVCKGLFKQVVDHGCRKNAIKLQMICICVAEEPAISRKRWHQLQNCLQTIPHPYYRFSASDRQFLFCHLNAMFLQSRSASPCESTFLQLLVVVSLIIF